MTSLADFDIVRKLRHLVDTLLLFESNHLLLRKMTGGAPEIRSDKSLLLLTFGILYLTFDFWNLTFNQWTNGPMDQWTNGLTDQWTNRHSIVTLLTSIALILFGEYGGLDMRTAPHQAKAVSCFAQDSVIVLHVSLYELMSICYVCGGYDMAWYFNEMVEYNIEIVWYHGESLIGDDMIWLCASLDCSLMSCSSRIYECIELFCIGLMFRDEYLITTKS